MTKEKSKEPACVTDPAQLCYLLFDWLIAGDGETMLVPASIVRDLKGVIDLFLELGVGVFADQGTANDQITFATQLVGKRGKTVKVGADFINCYIFLIAPNICEIDAPVSHFVDVMARFAGVRSEISIVRKERVVWVVSDQPVRGHLVNVRFDLDHRARRAEDLLPEPRKFSIANW